MQFIVHLPVLNTSFPSNAFLLVKSMNMVVSFDIPYLTTDSTPGAVNLPTDTETFTEDTEQNLKSALE